MNRERIDKALRRIEAIETDNDPGELGVRDEAAAILRAALASESGEGEGIKRIVLEPRGNQWVVKVDGFYGGYVSDAQARALIGFGIPAP